MKKINILQLLLFLEIIFGQANAQTTIILQPNSSEGKDASVLSANANKNYGNIESIVVYTWTYSSVLAQKRVFLEFDFLSIPENATITNAKLSLFYNPTDTTEPTFDYHTGENDLCIQRVTSEWDESTITWNNQPTTTSINQVQLPPSTSPTQDYLDIDVTDLVAEMANPSIGNNGFMLRMVDEINPYKCVLFASSDYIDTLLHPMLEITYILDSINFYANSDTLCIWSCIDFTGLSTENPVSWEWYFENAEPDTSTLQNPQNICYPDTGHFDVQLIVYNDFGSDTLLMKDYIMVLPEPDINLGNDTTIRVNETILLDAGAGYYSYLWQDGSTVQTYMANDSGIYWVTVSNEYCLGSDSILIMFKDCEASLFVPNCFTPNGDFINDKFHATGININEFEMLIFNRWGELLFETNDINEGWDGKNKGILCPSGVYFYLINYESECNYMSGEESQKKGAVTLLK